MFFHVQRMIDEIEGPQYMHHTFGLDPELLEPVRATTGMELTTPPGDRGPR